MEYTSSAYPILDPTSSVNNDTMGTIGSKPKTQTDYQREHATIEPHVANEFQSQKEEETGDIDFMRKWIQEKSGKKDPVSQKRKPKTTKEWEDEFDIGGNS
jgi:hypothetical protein